MQFLMTQESSQTPSSGRPCASCMSLPRRALVPNPQRNTKTGSRASILTSSHVQSIDCNTTVAACIAARIPFG
jgi:hypothetical protein